MPASAPSDRLYLASLWAAMGATAWRWWRRPRLAAHAVAGNQRTGSGAPELVLCEQSGVRCVACWLCVAACPTACIHMEAEPEPMAAGRRLTSLYVEQERCLHCGNCVMACPVGALRQGDSGTPVALRRALRSLMPASERASGARQGEPMGPA
jgi:formate hydrogenlyase subunit 6/NADH:ubiquinone oxidoreductase subunit I